MDRQCADSLYKKWTCAALWDSKSKITICGKLALWDSQKILYKSAALHGTKKILYKK